MISKTDAERLRDRMEPDTDRSYHERDEDYLASIAVSLKRIADYLEKSHITAAEYVDELRPQNLAPRSR